MGIFQQIFDSLFTRRIDMPVGALHIGGVAVERTADEINNGGGGITAPLLTYSGKFENPYRFIASPSFAMTDDPDGEIDVPVGSWLKSFVYYETGTETDPLTSVEFTNVVGVLEHFIAAQMPVLETLSLPVLAFVGGDFSPYQNAALATLSIPNLVTVKGQFAPATMASLTSIDAPSLVSVGSNIDTLGDFRPFNLVSLTSINCPALRAIVGNFEPTSLPNVTSLNFPALEVITKQIKPGDMSGLTSMTFPAIRFFAGINFSGGGLDNLETCVFGSTLKCVFGDVSMAGAALDEASVDGILISLAALDGSGGTTLFQEHSVNLSGGTSSPPSATGLAAKATLQDRDCTVTTN